MFVNAEPETRLPLAKERKPGWRLMARRRARMPGLGEYIERVAGEHGIDPRLVHAIIEVESAWDPWVVSRKGAVGLMQLLPETGRRFGAANLLNPQENIAAGVRYLRFLLDQFPDDLDHALAAYNAGENNVWDWGGVPPYRETEQYVERIRALYGDGSGQTASGRASPLNSGRIYQEVDEGGRTVFANF